MQVCPLNKDHLLLCSSLEGNTYSLLCSMPAFHKWQGRDMRIRINGANLAYIISTWPDAEWIGGANEHKVNFLSKIGAEQAAVEAKSTGAILPDDSGYQYKRQPMEHQRWAFLASRDMKACAYLMEQGTGKTKVVIDNACYLYTKGEIECLIIIAWPNGVHRMWVDTELPQDCSVPYAAQFWSSNLTKAKSFAIERVLQSGKLGKLPIMTFNVEAFVADKAKDCLLSFLDRYKCMVVIDQSASISNPSAKRTQFVIDDISSHHNAKYKRIMDGDPVAEGADELYSQFKFLDPWIIGHDTWTGFKNEYCIINPRWRSVEGYKNLGALHKLIDPYCFRIMADDCLDLPDRIYKCWDFDLGKEERRIFDELKSKSLTFFSPRPEDEEALEDMPQDGFIEEKLAIVKNMRLQQISSGWWPEASDFKSIEGKPSRLSALLLLLEAAKGKALIFARFRADLEAIQKALGKRAVSYHGGIGEEARAKNKQAFMENPDVWYFVGQPRNAGIGHTLTEAKHVIFYSNDHSLRLRAESEKRAHRMGLKHTLIIWDLCARKTQDKKIVDCLRKKRHLAAEILKDKHNFFLEYENE